MKIWNQPKKYENTKEEHMRLERQLEEFDASIESNKTKYNELLLSKEKAEGEIKVLNEQINSLLQMTNIIEKESIPMNRKYL